MCPAGVGTRPQTCLSWPSPPGKEVIRTQVARLGAGAREEGPRQDPSSSRSSQGQRPSRGTARAALDEGTEEGTEGGQLVKWGGQGRGGSP